MPAGGRIANANRIAEDMINKYDISCKILRKADSRKT